RAWDLTTGKRLPQFAGEHGQHVMAVALSPDGKLLASGGYDDDKGYRFVLWDVATGKKVQRPRGFSGGVITLAFSPVPLEGGGPPRWLLATGGGRRTPNWRTRLLVQAITEDELGRAGLVAVHTLRGRSPFTNLACVGCKEPPRRQVAQRTDATAGPGSRRCAS